MPTTRMSTKGQLVIPKAMREALGLKAGTEVRLRLVGDKILLEPLGVRPPLEQLTGRFAAVDLLAELEREHREELQDDEALRP